MMFFLFLFLISSVSSAHEKLRCCILFKDLSGAITLVQENRSDLRHFLPCLFDVSIAMARSERFKMDPYVPENFPISSHKVHFSNFTQISAYLADNFEDVNFLLSL